MALERGTTFGRITRAAEFHDAGYGYDVFGLHPPTLAAATALAAPLYERYFRVDSHGIEHVPSSGAAILVANHSGVLPVDAAMLSLDVLRRSPTPRIPRTIADHFVPRLPLINTLFARLGMVSGTRGNVRELIERGELIAIFPEGVSGPAKPFHDRYRIQGWRVGFAELAIRHRVPVIPIAIVGAEESWPVVARLRLRMFGSPYFPIPAVPFPLPARYHIRYGAPMHLDRQLIAAHADDPDVVARAAARVRTAVEQLLAESIAAREGVFR